MADAPRDFLLEDYKQRIGYLTNHFQRMWMRFNFFVTLEAALLGGKVLLVGDKPTPVVGAAGVILSLVWYLMGAQDRFLADFYRWQVKEAAGRVGQAFGEPPTAERDLSEDGKERQADVVAAAWAAARDHVGMVEDPFIVRYRAWRDGEIKGSLFRGLECVSSWRSKSFSPTHLASWIPLIAVILWLLYAAIQLLAR